MWVTCYVMLKHVKIFTLKYVERTESFNDRVISNFLADKEILSRESHFFERKNDYFQAVLLQHRPLVTAQTEPVRKTEKSRDGSYRSGMGNILFDSWA
jgi:hypothetical protein